MEDEAKVFRQIRCLRSRQKMHPDDREMVINYVQNNNCVDALSFMLDKCEQRTRLLNQDGVSARQHGFDTVNITTLNNWNREHKNYTENINATQNESDHKSDTQSLFD